MDYIGISFTLTAGFSINKRISLGTWDCKSIPIYAWCANAAKGISVWISIKAISMAIPIWFCISFCFTFTEIVGVWGVVVWGYNWSDGLNFNLSRDVLD
jgi:hypothetical protein